MPNYASLQDGQSYTREVYSVGRNGRNRAYAGYGKFVRDSRNGDQYQGSRGGYGPQGRGIRSDRTGNVRTNNASMLQNNINMAGVQSGRRRSQATRGTSVRL